MLRDDQDSFGKESRKKGTSLITGKTIVCGLIGDPVEHSMSPVMQNAAFKALNLDYIYLPFRVNKQDLNAAINGIRALNIRGINVTIPHKVSVMPLLDRIDSLASIIGAVNTIVNDDGLLTGYNTDAGGFIQSLIEKGINPTGKNVLILGAGGAARAVAFTLIDRESKLALINRSLDKAKELAKQLSQHFSRTIEVFNLNEVDMEKATWNAEIIVNTTSIGMNPRSQETPIPSRFLKPDTVVYDIVYNPIKTILLKEAELAGAMIISGTDMLAWQGALAFEKWTKQEAPIELMKNEVYRQLA
jgi:shikimate dehydrogenase